MKKILITTFFILFLFLPKVSEAEIKPIFEGNIDSKIKLIIYESLTCGHCANFHEDVYPSLKEDFIDKDYVSIEFRNFPLNMAAFNASSVRTLSSG